MMPKMFSDPKYRENKYSPDTYNKYNKFDRLRMNEVHHELEKVVADKLVEVGMKHNPAVMRRLQQRKIGTYVPFLMAYCALPEDVWSRFYLDAYDMLVAIYNLRCEIFTFYRERKIEDQGHYDVMDDYDRLLSVRFDPWGIHPCMFTYSNIR